RQTRRRDPRAPPPGSETLAQPGLGRVRAPEEEGSRGEAHRDTAKDTAKSRPRPSDRRSLRGTKRGDDARLPRESGARGRKGTPRAAGGGREKGRASHTRDAGHVDSPRDAGFPLGEVYGRIARVRTQGREGRARERAKLGGVGGQGAAVRRRARARSLQRARDRGL